MRSSLCSLGLAATTALVPGRVIALLAGLGLLCQAARAGNPNLLFTKLPDSHDTPTASAYTALADLDGDGRPDLIRTVPDTGGGAGSVGVQLGLGSGSFAAGTYSPAGALPGPIVVADFDNDGKLDVVVANLGTADNGSLSVLLGNGNGTLQGQTVISLGLVARRLVVTDYNQDGKADLVTVGYHSGAIPLEGYSVTLPGNGNGTFGPPTFYVNSARTAYANTRDVVVGDFNGDTWPDYIVSNPVGQAVAVFFNNHDGTFTRRAREMWLPGNVASLATGDFNGDGKLDLAFITASDTTYGNTGVGNNVGVVDGNGDGTFGSLRTDLGPLDIVSDVRIYSARPAGDTLVRPSSRLVAHDMDGNGTLDLVFLAEPMQGLYDVLSILRGAGNGTFAFGAQLVASYSSVWISVADLNQDSAVDLIVSPNGATTQAYLGIPPGGGTSVVTTALDEDNGTADPNVGTGTSLREAWNQALTQVTPQTINFAANLAGQTIYLTNVGSTVSGSSALAVSAGRYLTVQGLPGDAGITIDGGGILRPFFVAYDFGGGGSGTLTLNDLTIQNGRSTYGGGVFNLGTLTMRRCTLTRNSASNQGGALYTGASYATGARALLVNCTIANNTGLHPGIMSDSARLDLLNVTISSNSSPGGISAGGGIFMPNSTVTMTNTIVAGNSPKDIDAGNVHPESRNNLIGTGGSGGLVNGVNGNLVGVANPRLGPLASNGGPTPTARLLPGSPAIDAGAAVPAVAGVNTDQRGVARPVGAALDIGAYEFAVMPSLVVSTTVDEDNGNSDPVFGTGTSLREALRYAASLGGAQTITFSPALAGQMVTLNTGWNDANDSAALRVAGNLTVQGLTTSPGVTLAVQSGVQKRHFLVEGSGNLTLAHLTLTNGFASDFGGSVWSFGSLTVRNCTFTGNHAGAEGGAIQSWGDSPSLLIENSTFSGNTSAGIASAIDAGAVRMTLRYVTITGNAATNALGALVLWKNQATLVNSIVAGNSDDGLGLVNGGSFSVASVNNLIGTGGSGGLVNGVNGNLVAVPTSRLYLAPLTANGGPTPTVAPLPGSPAINAGVAFASLTTDQRGLARTVGAAPDIGAVEDSVGNDDPDGDTLTNVQELALGTNPLAIDSDGDGFNDATEMLASSNPNSAASIPPATHSERVLGYGPARGLDLSGSFLYAFNVGPNGAAGQAGDANFTADNAPGITVSAPNAIAEWTVREFGNSAADDVLEMVYRSIRWADLGNADPELRRIKVDLANLVPGRPYKLQLLFAEAGDYNRRFDVVVSGELIADDFNPSTAQGSPVSSKAAAALVHEFTATNSTLHIVLDGASISVPVVDRNPILNGVTLEDLAIAAAAPQIAPAGGTYQGSVTVTLSATNAGATVRYTTDGSAPSETHGDVYAGPFTLWTDTTVRAIAVGGVWLPSAEASATFTVQTEAQGWRAMQGLPADGSQDLANPSGDGVPNLLKYAFNLAPNAGDLLVSNRTLLPPGGTAGLPAITVDAQQRLVFQFVRRKAATNPGIGYVVEVSPELSSWSALDLSGATVESIDGTWERVTITDPTAGAMRFGRMGVTYFGSYQNNFDSGLGAATLRGTAVHTNQAVMLTDLVGGQLGAVVFDGLTAGPANNGFTARFTANLGPQGQVSPADGISLAVGDVAAGPWAESGPGTARHLAVGFDTYNNGGIGDIGIHLWANGTHIASSPVNPFTDGATVPVEISYDAASGVTVKFNGATIFSNVALPGFSLPAGSRFGIGARTGGSVERAVVDDVEIFTR